MHLGALADDDRQLRGIIPNRAGAAADVPAVRVDRRDDHFDQRRYVERLRERRRGVGLAQRGLVLEVLGELDVALGHYGRAVHAVQGRGGATVFGLLDGLRLVELVGDLVDPVEDLHGYVVRELLADLGQL